MRWLSIGKNILKMIVLLGMIAEKNDHVGIKQEFIL